jgi:hypothetical protein
MQTRTELWWVGRNAIEHGISGRETDRLSSLGELLRITFAGR